MASANGDSGHNTNNMTIDRWEEIKHMIHNSFTVTDEYEEEYEPGYADVVEFEKNGDLYRALFISKPRVEEKKTLYSHRAGGEVHVEYTYSDDETVTTFALEKKNESGDWDPVDTAQIF